MHAGCHPSRPFGVRKHGLRLQVVKAEAWLQQSIDILEYACISFLVAKAKLSPSILSMDASMHFAKQAYCACRIRSLSINYF